MNIYLLNVVIIITLGIFTGTRNKAVSFAIVTPNHKNLITLSFVCFVSFLLLFIEMAFRGDFAIDTLHYYTLFKTAIKSFPELLHKITKVRDPLYQLITVIVYQFTNKYIYFLMTIAFIMSFCYIMFVKTQSSIEWLSVLILFCSGSYYTGFNVMRNVMVASMFALLYPLIYGKKPFKYLISVLVLSGLHLSALFTLPCYFFLNKKWDKRSTGIMIISIIILSLLSYFFAARIANIAAIYIYGGYSYGMDEGVGLLGTLKSVVMSGGVLLCFKFFDMGDARERFIYNGCILYLIIAICGYRVFIIQRLTHYFVPCLMIAYPLIINKLLSVANKQLAMILTIGMFVGVSLNNIIKPNYYFFWEKNMRYGDFRGETC